MSRDVALQLPPSVDVRRRNIGGGEMAVERRRSSAIRRRLHCLHAVGILISVGVAGVWEVIENAPFVASVAKTTRVHGYVGDGVVKFRWATSWRRSRVFSFAAGAPTWVSIVILGTILFVLPRDNPWIFAALN
jgi:hypothetical protein